jgi:hypothetical protein
MEAECSRRKVHEGAELHWVEYTVKPKALEIEAQITACQTDEERQQLADEILKELRQADRGFIRGGGASVSAAIDASDTVRSFVIDALIVANGA